MLIGCGVSLNRFLTHETIHQIALLGQQGTGEGRYGHFCRACGGCLGGEGLAKHGVRGALVLVVALIALRLGVWHANECVRLRKLARNEQAWEGLLKP